MKGDRDRERERAPIQSPFCEEKIKVQNGQRWKQDTAFEVPTEGGSSKEAKDRGEHIYTKYIQGWDITWTQGLVNFTHPVASIAYHFSQPGA